MKELEYGIMPKYSAVVLVASVCFFVLVSGCNPLEKSGKSNVVVVEKESDFTGEFLKHSRSLMYERLPTPECVKKDMEIDKGDGPRKGRVRWAECLKGPDCNEAGMF